MEVAPPHRAAALIAEHVIDPAEASGHLPLAVLLERHDGMLWQGNHSPTLGALGLRKRELTGDLGKCLMHGNRAGRQVHA